MINVLRICREYGRSLDWFDQLSSGEQAIYLADLRIRTREG